MTARYFEALDTFIELCKDLARTGQPYGAVLLGHELYRYLYPIEPYARFTHTDPVAFITSHIESLVTLGRELRGRVSPYEMADTPLMANVSAEEGLHRQTSDFYSKLWREFDSSTLTQESVALLARRLPEEVIQSRIVGKRVLDMGCGSGRYTIALARLGAGSVTGVDVLSRAFSRAVEVVHAENLPVTFQEANFLELPFPSESFDFVFCNGTLHHSASLQGGIDELVRVLRRGGSAFLYLYAAGGIYWKTRERMREVFALIPLEYTQAVLRMIGMPSNRFVFCDTWYVPVEMHTTRLELEGWLEGKGLRYSKLTSRNEFDLDGPVAADLPGAVDMWGDGEHRYLLERSV